MAIGEVLLLTADALGTAVQDQIATHTQDDTRHPKQGSLVERPSGTFAEGIIFLVTTEAEGARASVYKNGAWVDVGVTRWNELKNKPTADNIGGVMKDRLGVDVATLVNGIVPTGQLPTADRLGGLLASARGEANGVAELVNGLLPTSRMPNLTISQTHPNITTEAAMLALDAQLGDLAVRTDFDPDRVYILAGGGDPKIVANWIRISFGDVASVNNQQGAIVLGHADVGASPQNHSIRYHPDVSATLPNDGDALLYNAALGVYVPAQPPGAQSLTGVWDPGDIKVSARLTPAVGWIRADGTALSRASYPNLFEAITKTTGGTTSAGSPVVVVDSTAQMEAGDAVEGPGIPIASTILSIDSAVQLTLSANAATGAGAGTIRAFPYGQGDGSTTFTAPDLVGRAIAGAGAKAGLTYRRRGAKAGVEDVTLAITEIPAHAHGGAVGSTNPTATHSHSTYGHSASNTQVGGSSTRVSALTGPGSYNDIGSSSSVNPTATHSHTIASQGGGAAHLNMQPTSFLNVFVKT